MDPIGDDTFYTVLARAPGEIRPFQFEGVLIESAEEVLATIDQFPEGYSLWCVFRHDYDIPRQNVTEDISRRGYVRWREAGNHPSDDALPRWLREHLPADLDTGYRVKESVA